LSEKIIASTSVDGKTINVVVDHNAIIQAVIKALDKPHQSDLSNKTP